MADAPGTCAGTVCSSLRAAVNAADGAPGSTVRLGPGTFKLGSGQGSPIGTGELRISASMTLTGAGPGRTIIQQTDGQDRVIDVDNVVKLVTVSHLTISGGTLGAGAPEPGPAIYTLAPLALRDVTVSGNQETSSSGPSGGGVAVGAIVSLDALTLIHSKISNNRATASPGAGGAGATAGSDGNQAVGGILATKSSQLTLTDSTVSGNTATAGPGGSSASGAGGAGGQAVGGLYVIDNAPLKASRSTFGDNQAQGGPGGAGATGGSGGAAYGGGLFTPDGRLQIVSSTFSGNVALGGAGGTGAAGAGGAGGEARGGGVAGGSRSLSNSILNSTFYANQAVGGAGGSGSPAGNAALSAGGGVAENVDASLAIVSSTFVANQAVGAGTGRGGNLYDQPSPITIAQSIFTGGVASVGSNCAIAAAEVDHGHNLESTAPSSCGFSRARHDLIGTNPRLSPLAANGGSAKTMALLAGSPAIRTGGTCRDYTKTRAPALRTDERGKRRRVPCDIGAFQRGRAARL
jgi:hypothetical protein